MKKYILILTMFLSIFSCSTTGKIYETGIASYYGGKYHGRKTASGKIFNKYELTAAHKTLPFGTIVKVTNLANNKSVIVTITDRGPFIKGRIIDLSEEAFKKIEDTKKGITKVHIKIIKTVKKGG